VERGGLTLGMVYRWRAAAGTGRICKYSP